MLITMRRGGDFIQLQKRIFFFNKKIRPRDVLVREIRKSAKIQFSFATHRTHVIAFPEIFNETIQFVRRIIRIPTEPFLCSLSSTELFSLSAGL